VWDSDHPGPYKTAEERAREIDRIKRTIARLEQAAAKSVEKGAQEGLGQLMGAAGSRLHDLLAWLFT
jgi:hypothetical protein